MNARTFGKKARPAARPAAASRRAAFLAQERARADGESRAADTEVFPGRGRRRSPTGSSSSTSRRRCASRSGRARCGSPGRSGSRSASPACTGSISAATSPARSRPALFIGCVVAVFGFQLYPAFAGLVISWLWMLVDGLSLKQMHAEAVGTPQDAAVVEV